MRAELSPAERAQSTARRKAIYLELHPETAAGVAGAAASNKAQGNATANLATASFAQATAAATGTSKRAVRRDAERGEKITNAALAKVIGTHLNTGSYLDKLKAGLGYGNFLPWIEAELRRFARLVSGPILRFTSGASGGAFGLSLTSAASLNPAHP